MRRNTSQNRNFLRDTELVLEGISVLVAHYFSSQFCGRKRNSPGDIFCKLSLLFQGLIEPAVSVSVSGEFQRAQPSSFCAALGPAQQRCVLPAQEQLKETLFWSQGMGSAWPWQCKRVKVEQDTLVEAFCGAMRAAYECSFPFWCSGAVPPQEAEEVTFQPPFCLPYLSGASQTLSRCLCIQGWVLPCAEHTQPCEHPLTPQGSGQTGLPGSVCTQRSTGDEQNSYLPQAGSICMTKI